MINAVLAPDKEDLYCNHLHGERGVTNKIKQAMFDAAKQFVYIGYLLWEVKEYEYFYEGNYTNVYEYAEAELGFKRSSTKNFIAIAETFGTRKQGSDTIRTMSLQKEYSDYSYSQLTEMLSMSPAQRQQTTPSMTIKQLREIKKNHEPEQTTFDDLQNGQTSGQQERQQAVTINNFWYDINPEIVESLCKTNGIKYNPKYCYDITIKLHPKT